jgi:hypothetical protein
MRAADDPPMAAYLRLRRAKRSAYRKFSGNNAWSPKEGAHLLLQTRVRTLNGELGAIFKRWYPDMDLEVDEMPGAA